MHEQEHELLVHSYYLIIIKYLDAKDNPLSDFVLINQAASCIKLISKKYIFLFYLIIFLQLLIYCFLLFFLNVSKMKQKLYLDVHAAKNIL